MGYRLVALALISNLVSLDLQASPKPSEVARKHSREWVILNRTPSEPGAHDQVEDLVDEVRVRTLIEMEREGLTEVRLPIQPWSDYYWPIYGGVLAYRYADHEFPASRDWKMNRDYLLSRLRDSPLDIRSPSEKYDLLIGDRGFSLTKALLREGAEYYEAAGEVEPWMGICHGWAAASYMEKRPTRSVQVRSPDGDLIEFRPSDIKALASLLWANSEAPTRFIGGRCNDRDPDTNRSGRPRSESCLDNNPGTWHLAVVNQIGVSRRSFILDASWDYEVWNQPVVGYRYELFNVLSGETARSALTGQVFAHDYRSDPYRRHRSLRARSIIGVRMTVEYMIETSPSAIALDSEENDLSRFAHYEYDLELDSEGRIVGGEWHENLHPDFLWTVPPEGQARSLGDRILDAENDVGVWTDTDPVPPAWRRAARISVSHRAPLARIVRQLVEMSRR